MDIAALVTALTPDSRRVLAAALLGDLLGSAAVGTPVVTPAVVTPPVAPVAPPVVNMWTDDMTVVWVDQFGSGRNKHGVPSNVDPNGLKAFYALEPGRPVFTAAYPKDKRARAKYPNARSFPPVAAQAASVPAPAPAPAAPPTTSLDGVMRDWVSRNPHAAAELSSILGAGVGREYTYRDILALGGLVPARKQAAATK